MIKQNVSVDLFNTFHFNKWFSQKQRVNHKLEIHFTSSMSDLRLSGVISVHSGTPSIPITHNVYSNRISHSKQSTSYTKSQSKYKTSYTRSQIMESI